MTAKHASVVSKIIQKDQQPAEDTESRVSVESERQARTHPAMLVIIKKDGDELLLAYSLFRTARKTEGGSKWELVFDDCVVVLSGRNLGNKLRDMLRLQRLSILREGNAVEDDLAEEGEMFIESIKVRDREAA